MAVCSAASAAGSERVELKACDCLPRLLAHQRPLACTLTLPFTAFSDPLEPESRGQPAGHSECGRQGCSKVLAILPRVGSELRCH